MDQEERVIFEGHPSWRSILDHYVKGAVISLVIAGIVYLVDDTGLAATVFVALFALTVVVGYVRRIATVYTITNKRLRIKRGIIARRTQEARLERVQNVNTDQSVLQRILQIGTVDFDTAGTDDSEFKFAGVANPDSVVDAVDKAQREHQEQLRGTGVQPEGL
jgi:uncharacterized membrane protein YdbT with pleckstrin-like domain